MNCCVAARPPSSTNAEASDGSIAVSAIPRDEDIPPESTMVIASETLIEVSYIC